MPRVNLVPKEERTREARRQLYIVPVGGAIALAGLMAISFYYYNNQVDNAEQQLREMQAKNDGLQKQVAELDRYQDVKNKKQAQLNVVTSVYGQRQRWSRMLDDLAFVIPEDVWLTSINAKAPGAEAAAGASASGGANLRDVAIDGYTYEMPTVAIFIIRLGLIPSLTDVTLESAEKVELSNRLVTKFRITASIKQTAENQQPSVAPSAGSGSSPMTPTGTSTTPTGTSTTPTGATAPTTGTTR